jgi:hypothetical protein
MKKIAIVLGVLGLLVAAMSYNIWNASQQPVKGAPDALETGRQKLHSQLEDAKRTEAEAEKQDWNSATRLRDLINGHKQRIEKLTGNSQAVEIVAYDRESIARLERRIADLAAESAAKPVEQTENKQPVE